MMSLKDTLHSCVWSFQRREGTFHYKEKDVCTSGSPPAREKTYISIVRNLGQEPFPVRAIIHQMRRCRDSPLHFDLGYDRAKDIQLRGVHLHVHIKVFNLRVNTAVKLHHISKSTHETVTLNEY